MAKNEGKEVVMITEARVAEMIAAAITGLVNEGQAKVLIVESETRIAEQLAQMGGKVLSEEQVRALIGEYFTSEVLESTEEAEPFDPAWLAGLTVMGSVKQKPKAAGERPVWAPQARPLTQGDLLSWKVDGDTVTLISRDGQKHVVEI